ncbi:ATP-binding protein [Paraconexibacter sp. AEG42_29]|uniref:sensor histidine kinase n=1 Tax=Paraconexibacter sp. AEG42_29 TaxID=2997339 RepID=UPI00339D9F24
MARPSLRLALGSPDGALALFRLALTVALVAFGLIDHIHSPVYWIACGVGATLSVSRLAITVQGRVAAERQLASSVLLGGVLLATLATSGGIESDVRWLLPLIPPVFASYYDHRRVALVGSGLLVGYVAISVPDLAVSGDADAHDEVHAVLLTSVAIGLSAVTAVAAAVIRHDSVRRIRHLDQARRTLLRRALSAEYSARREISAGLYDETLQLLLGARQDIVEASAGDRDGLVLAGHQVDAAIDAVKAIAASLHPVALEHGGLAPAINALTEPLRELGVVIELQVDDAASGIADDVVVPIVRELLGNIARHASATTAAVWVVAGVTLLELDVSDNGTGFATGDGDSGSGLAFAAERAAMAGGTLTVATSAGGGTTVSVRLPLGADWAPAAGVAG